MDRLAENDFSARVDVLPKEVIANVSPELRSPLSVISGYAELVRDIHWKDEAARNEDARQPPRLTGSGSALTFPKSPSSYTPHGDRERLSSPRSVCLMLYLIGMFFLDLF